MAKSDIMEMTVNNMAFLIEKLHEDCSPIQFMRELTKNSIEAIQRTASKKGEIHWDLDWNRFELTNGAETKLCIIDNGVGMTGEEMVNYINQLSSSVHLQSRTGNFGVGAKISAAPMSPHGLVYLSWSEGRGYMIHLFRDENSKQYGLRRFDNGEFWQTVQSSVKPSLIDDAGTMVVLLGKSDEDNTMNAPAKAVMPKKWMFRYLNSRFYKFPEGITVKAREGWEREKGHTHNFLRTVTGQGPWLEENSCGSGSIRLDKCNAVAHWWLISEDAAISTGHVIPSGHVAMLFQDELYEVVQSNAGYARLQSFGVVFGGNRVVIYIEPDNGQANRVVSSIARTNLFINDEPVDWSSYASEFRDNMPDEIAVYQDRIGLSADQTDHRKAIRERLKSVKDLFRFGRYQSAVSGKHRISLSAHTDAKQSRSTPKISARDVRTPSSKKQKPDIYSLFTEEVGTPAEQINSAIEPKVTWISVHDGTRSPDNLEDRAARYLSDQNEIIINRDFRAFAEMIDRWENEYTDVPGAQKEVKAVVEEWFSQQLMETVMSALALRKNGKWSSEETEKLWSEDALTAAVLPRYHIHINVKRVLAQRLGKLKA